MIPLVLGEEEAVLGFALIGVKGNVPRDPAAAAEELVNALKSKEQLLVLITDKVARWIMPEIRKAVLEGAVIQVIPGPAGGATRKEEKEPLLLSALGIRL